LTSGFVKKNDDLEIAYGPDSYSPYNEEKRALDRISSSFVKRPFDSLTSGFVKKSDGEQYIDTLSNADNPYTEYGYD